jgi:hypothetical protein
VKGMVRSRLETVLSGKETQQRYAHLDGQTRRAISEILTATLPVS